MNSIAQNVEATSGQAEHKAHDLGHPTRYFVSAMLAGAYIGIGEILLLVAVSPFVAKGSAAVKLLEGGVFPIALTIVMFAGAQLFTSNVMVMLVGALSGRTGMRDLLSSWGLSLSGNLVGAFGFGAMVHASGVTSSPSARTMLAEMVHGKTALGGGQLFWRAVLCNMLVCLAIWMFTRARGDAAKIFVLWLPVAVFVAVGFEHCVANMAVFSLAILDGQAGFGDLFRNLMFTVPGNIVGGGLLVGAVYWFTGGARRERGVIASG
ncbi:formate/nitrite transporter family protein [Streptomyces sp. NBC_00536]|uniref:formate/nitrite transporter family protein n=1 Tax=Streptomyces sp. NBC_00536 TaxID=2975769 RepID=UPI002E8147FE|nr:formate/nitrite transporter family protein [Streptomyces sp. NBC_00536]WUC78404.1 formate/nitrite transporter family protein [Streptomyces sp. NBC_00536]